MDEPKELVEDREQAGSALDASYVLTWDEIASFAAEPGKPAETLMNVVALIARRFGTDVCSAYFLSLTAPIWCWRRPSVYGRNVSANFAWRSTKVSPVWSPSRSAP